jgi:hypothetical protein
MKNLKPGLSMLAAASLLAACGGGGSSSTATTPPGPTILQGQLVDASVLGVCYAASPSGQTGTTTANGSYSYVAGDSVAFWLPVNGSSA